jgi:hypothetical protein
MDWNGLEWVQLCMAHLKDCWSGSHYPLGLLGWVWGVGGCVGGGGKVPQYSDSWASLYRGSNSEPPGLALKTHHPLPPSPFHPSIPQRTL